MGAAPFEAFFNGDIGIRKNRRYLKYRDQKAIKAGRHWALGKNIKWLDLLVSAVLKLGQVTKHLEFMILSAKQEAICRALWNNEILISLKKEEEPNLCLKASEQRLEWKKII